MAGPPTTYRLQIARILFIATGAVIGTVLVVRRDVAGIDMWAYWYWTREWMAGGDPFQLGGPALPYVYAPWALPLFAPWALLPWDVAHAVWRAVTALGLVASIGWVYIRAPLLAAVALLMLAGPLAINLETGNVTLPIALAFFGALLVDQRLAAVLLGMATGMKWVTAPFILALGRQGRRWAVGTFTLCLAASVLLLPATVDQLQILVAFERPPPVAYLVLAWAVLPAAIGRTWNVRLLSTERLARLAALSSAAAPAWLRTQLVSCQRWREDPSDR